MYEFIDTIEQPAGELLPSEALNFNGEYIENLIPGYRTLYVSGREVMDSELTTYDVGISDGSKYYRKRYPARTITVGYMLKANSSEAFREAYNKLNAILDAEQAKLIFNDESDKYFVGTKETAGDVPAGVNTVKSEIVFYCADPFKYAVNEKTVSPTLDDNKTFAVNYAGTYKCYPTLVAQAKADLGFVAYVNQNGKIIQVGDVDEVDTEHFEVSQTLIDNAFSEYDASIWQTNSGSVLEHAQTGTVTIKNDKNQLQYVTGGAFGSGSTWHGPGISRQVPTDLNGIVGAKNCTLSWKHIFATSAYNELGGVQFLMTNVENGVRKNVAGVTFYKTRTGSCEANVYLYANGSRHKKIPFNCGMNNGVSGYGAGVSSFSKFGSKITYNICGKIYEIEVPELKDITVNEIGMYFGAYGTHTPMQLNGVYSVKFVAHGVDAWSDVPNKFTSNDIISAECRSGKVLVNGVETPGLGALGNDWEEFYLSPGENQINCTYSDWAVKPELALKYREVYL